MLKLCITLEEKNADRLQTVLEYIAHQIGLGYLAGEGWDIEGEEELSDDD